MKVKELRDTLKDKDVKLVNEAFVEVYKMLSKDKKEDADVMLGNILSGNGKVKKQKKEAEKEDLSALLDEAEIFLENANQGYYNAPNRIVPKSERPKWRFKVKKYLKTFLAVSIDDPTYPKVLEKIIQLYILLSKACGVYLFSSDDPFASVGYISQVDLYDCIIERMIPLGLNDQAIELMIQLACDFDLDPMTLHMEFHDRLLANLDLEEQRKDVIRIAKIMRENALEKLKKYKSKYQRPYELVSVMREYNDLIFIFLTAFGIGKKEVDDYLKYDQEKDEEVSMYKMLDYIDIFGADEDWVDVYEYMAVAKKVTPRKKLQEKYKELKKEING